MKKGYASTFEEAKRAFLLPSSKYYINRNHYTVEFIIDMILKSGGIPVLAHPCRIHMTDDEIETFISKMKLYGLQGIEAFYLMSSETQKSFYQSIALKNGLFVTAGSDWHSPEDNYNPGIELSYEKECEICVNLKI